MGNHYSSCEFNVISYGTQRCVGIIFVVIGKQQWGEYVDGYNTFSIEFTAFCVVAAGGEYMYDDLGSTILEIELHQFTALANLSGTKKTYIAAGKQQWGSGEGSHSSTQGYNTWEFIYPTPYTTSVLSLSITGTGHTTELGTNYCNTVTLSSVLVASHDKGYVIIIGIQQWGFKSGNNAKWTYPLPLSTLLYVDVSGDANGPDESVNYSKESFVTYADLTHLWFVTDTAGGDNRFLVIGTVQQWGYSAFIHGGKKVTFPIPYIAQCYGVVSQNIQTTTNFIVCAINDVDTTGFWDSNGSALGIYWLAFGKQQWGLTEEAYLPTIDFPVSFTSIPAVVGTPIKDYATSENYFGNNSIESVTASSFVPRQTNTNGGTKAGAIRYIAVGY